MCVTKQWSCRGKSADLAASEIEVNQIFLETLRIQAPELSTVLNKRQVESVLCGLGREESHDDKGWKLVTSGTRRKSPASLACNIRG